MNICVYFTFPYCSHNSPSWLTAPPHPAQCSLNYSDDRTTTLKIVLSTTSPIAGHFHNAPAYAHCPTIMDTQCIDNSGSDHSHCD